MLLSFEVFFFKEGIDLTKKVLICRLDMGYMDTVMQFCVLRIKSNRDKNVIILPCFS